MPRGSLEHISAAQPSPPRTPTIVAASATARSISATEAIVAMGTSVTIADESVLAGRLLQTAERCTGGVAEEGDDGELRHSVAVSQDHFLA